MGEILPSSVEAMKSIHLEGNVLPLHWLKQITFENGRPDTTAALILSDIVYWYRPRLVRDEQTGFILGYEKKFKRDLLQKSYSDYENLFGFSKKQLRDSFVRLESLGLIRRVFRTLHTGFGLQSNVMFIELFPSKLLELNQKIPPYAPEETSYFPEGEGVLTSTSLPPDVEVKTYTKITPEITPETSSSDFCGEGEEEEEVLFLRIGIGIWNRFVQGDLGEVRETRERVKRFSGLMKDVFAQDLSAWERFCEKVSRTPFLMGKGPKGWRVSFDWILDSKHALKVLEGHYWGSESVQAQVECVQLTEVQKLEEVESRSQFQSSDPRWILLARKLCEREGFDRYRAWFWEVDVLFEGSCLHLSFSSLFRQDQVRHQFGESLRTLIRGIDPGVDRVEIHARSGGSHV